MKFMGVATLGRQKVNQPLISTFSRADTHRQMSSQQTSMRLNTEMSTTLDLEQSSL